MTCNALCCQAGALTVPRSPVRNAEIHEAIVKEMFLDRHFFLPVPKNLVWIAMPLLAPIRHVRSLTTPDRPAGHNPDLQTASKDASGETATQSTQDDVRPANILTIRKEKTMNVIPMKAPMKPDENSLPDMIPTIGPMILDIKPYKNSTPDGIPMKAPMFPNNAPNENSSLEELAAYALHKQKQIFARDKMNGEDLWLMGQALTWAKKSVRGKWEKWWKAQGLRKTYVWQARKLYERATLDDVKELGVTEALLKFKIVAEKKAKHATATVPTAAIEKMEDTKATPASDEEATEPTEQEEDGSDPEPEEQSTDALAEEEEKELKEWQDALRQQTPKTRAVAILHALEHLRDDLNEEEVDEELRQTFSQIAELAEELKGLNKQIDANEAA
jgi:hypothetical protein